MKQNIFNGLVPMMAVFMLLTICPINVDAKKIKYSEQIVYNGKVDANGQPNGEGTLTTTYGEYKNILEGFFNNGVVSNATLRLRVYDKKYEYFHYNGDVEFAVIDNKSVSYTIKSGTPICGGRQIKIDSCQSFHIITTLDAGSCYIKSNSISEWLNYYGNEYLVGDNLNLAFRYANSFCLEKEDEVKIKQSFRLDNFCELVSDNPLISVKDKERGHLQVYGDTISVSYTNGDYVICYGNAIDERDYTSTPLSYKKATIIALKKTLKDGVLGCEKPGIVTFTDNITQKTGIAVLKAPHNYNYSHIHPLYLFDKNFGKRDYYVNGNIVDNHEIRVFYGKAGEAIFKVINEEPKGYLDFGAALIDEGNVEEAKYWINKAINSGLPEAKEYLAKLEAKAAEEREKERLNNEAILQTYKQRAIQNKDKVLAYDIAYGYETGKGNFVQNDDSAMVWYKKCVAYGNDPTKSDKPNLYKAYKRIEQLRSIIGKYEKLLPKYTKKYGQSAGTSLYKGRFNGLSFAAVNEFVRDLNSAENKYVLKAYEPTVGDVIRYGRGVKNYTLFSTGTFAIKQTEFKVLNGKVIAQSNDYFRGMEEIISSYNESLEIYRGEGWIRRLDRINNK